MKKKMFLLFIFSSVFFVLGNSCASNSELYRPYADSGYKGGSDFDDNLFVMGVGGGSFRSSEYNYNHSSSYSYASSQSFFGSSSSSSSIDSWYSDSAYDSSSYWCSGRDRTDYSPPDGIPDWVYKK